ncbi:hypothetical protein LCE44_26555 [Vibrio harveyi]|uniref:hypothetical protein n=1 Tax=Vibrio harveyi TaxID=669 RepID=UPI003BF6E681
MKNRVNLELTGISSSNWYDLNKKYVGDYLEAFILLDRLEVKVSNVTVSYNDEVIPATRFSPYLEGDNIKVVPEKELTYPFIKKSDLQDFFSVKKPGYIFSHATLEPKQPAKGYARALLVITVEYYNPFALTTTSTSVQMYAYFFRI